MGIFTFFNSKSIGNCSRVSKLNFKQIIQTIQEIKNCYKENLNALQEDHRRKITLSDSSSCEGSITQISNKGKLT